MKTRFKFTQLVEQTCFSKKFSLEDTRKTENLFVISHLGQLMCVERFIREKKIFKDSSALIILYTKKNTLMPDLIREKMDKTLFGKVFLLRLPSFPNKIHIRNLFFIKNTYKDMIDYLKPLNLFVLSFEGHYAILLEYAKEKKIQNYLIEEGTATYKYSNNIQKTNQYNIKNLPYKQSLSAFWIRYLPIMKGIRAALKIFKNFNTIYATFPEKLEHCFEAKSYKYFFPYDNIDIDENIKNIQIKYQLTESDVIFLNQRYPYPPHIYAEILIDFLLNLNKNVFIKFHHKDTEETKRAINDEIKNKNLNLKIKIFEEDQFPIEELIYLVNPDLLIGLTSTGLIYANKVSRKTKALSIYPYIRQSLVNKIGDKKELFKESDEHFNILTQFESVSIFNANIQKFVPDNIIHPAG